MAKDNESFYKGLTIHFPTKHEKEAVLAPLLFSLGISCKVVSVDTDAFGTFSGEVERSGSVRETLRKKVRAAVALHPNERLFLASEGSYGPHPIHGLFQTGLESLLLFDRELDLEIYAEFLDTKPVHVVRTLTLDDEVGSFLADIDFPAHAVIVHPKESLSPLFKGLKSRAEIENAIVACRQSSPSKQVIIATDLRANLNSTRRLAIAKAGDQLVEKLRSLCPSCGVPGFAIARGVPGLPCAGCGERTTSPQKVLWECVKCVHFEERPRPDGVTELDPEDCEFCNP